MTDLLRREMPPIADEAWKHIDLQSSRILKGNLSGRKLVDFCGSFGGQFAAVNLGKLDVGPAGPVEGVVGACTKSSPSWRSACPSPCGSGNWMMLSGEPRPLTWWP